MKLTKRKAFNFLRSYYDVLNKIKEPEDKLNFLLAIIDKQFIDEDPKDLNFIVDLSYSSQRHSVESSVKGWKRASKTTLAGHPLTDPPTTPMGNPPTNPKEEEEKEEEEVQGEEKEKYVKSFSFKGFLIDYGFQEKLVLDWMLVRKTKKATNTQTAYNAFINELEKKPCDINEILTLIISKDWKGFKWAWVEKENPAAKDNVFSILEKEYKQITQTT